MAASANVISAVLVVVIVVAMVVCAYFQVRAVMVGEFGGRTDPFWTPSMVDVPTRRFYDAASGPSGDSRAPWGATYWAPGCPAR